MTVIPSAHMAKGVVLVIEDDEWVSRLLSAAIRDADYEVVVCTTAKDGLKTVTTREPDCIVSAVNLPDNDGFWVAQNVRTQPSRVSVTPFLFLSGQDDPESRLQGFHVGADVYMTKPFRVDDVVAQVEALVQMAKRLRERRDSFMSIPPEAISAITGDLSQMSIATVLTVLEMERRSGTFDVMSKKRRAQLELASGFVLDGTVGGTKVSTLTALRTMLGWNVGRFSFVPSPTRPAPKEEKSIGAFLLEAVRLQDESARAALELELDLPPASVRRTSDHKLAAPALGGPPSTVEDFAPPSSRTPATMGSPLTKPSATRFTPRPAHYVDASIAIELDPIHLESDAPPSAGLERSAARAPLHAPPPPPRIAGPFAPPAAGRLPAPMVAPSIPRPAASPPYPRSQPTPSGGPVTFPSKSSPKHAPPPIPEATRSRPGPPPLPPTRKPAASPHAAGTPIVPATPAKPPRPGRPPDLKK
jgi:two-component system, OmpR family, response regulator